MAIKTISQFDAATPASNDKILFEQNGEGKSASFEDVGKIIGINMDLLWTNASPTSNFDKQTISLNLSNYQMVYIVIRRSTENNNLHNSLIVKKGESGFVFAYLGGLGLLYREIESVSNSGVNFGVGVMNATTDNKYGIPIYIYGIK